MSKLTLNNCPNCNRSTLKPKPSKDKILIVYCSSCREEYDGIQWKIDENKKNRSIMTGTRRNAGVQRYNLGYDES